MSYDFDHIKEIKFPDIYADKVFLKYKTLNSLVFKSGDSALIVRPAINISKLMVNVELARRKEAVFESKRLFRGLILKTDHIVILGKLESDRMAFICKVMPWFNEVKELRELSVSEIVSSRKLLSILSQVNSCCISYFLKTGKLYDLFKSKYNTVASHKDNFIKRFVNPNIMVGKNSKSNLEEMFIDSDWYIKFSDYRLTDFSIFSYFKVITLGLTNLLVGYILFSILLLRLKIK